MAASKKSTVLGLCLWEGTDKPRRVDFVADNEAIESQLGGHIQNDNLHLRHAQKAFRYADGGAHVHGHGCGLAHDLIRLQSECGDRFCGGQAVFAGDDGLHKAIRRHSGGRPEQPWRDAFHGAGDGAATQTAPTDGRRWASLNEAA